MNGQIDAVIIDEAPAKEFVAANEGLTILPGNWWKSSIAPPWMRATPHCKTPSTPLSTTDG